MALMGERKKLVDEVEQTKQWCGHEKPCMSRLGTAD